MKDKKDSRRNIRKIGPIVFVVIVVVVFNTTPVSAEDKIHELDSKVSVNDDGVSSGYIYLQTDGNKIMTAIDGRIGIGDETPDFKLEVAGSSDGGYFGVSSAPSNDGDIFIIDSSGNVGIAVASPGAKLEVGGSAVFNPALGDYDFRIAGDSEANLFYVDASYDCIGIGTATTYHKLTIQSTNDNTLRLIGPDGVFGYGARLNFGDQDFVYIDEDEDDKLYIYGRYRIALMGGDVGIGTASPGAKLDVHVSSGGAATIGSQYNVATGNCAIAMGDQSWASGRDSFAMGYLSTASGNYSAAIGYRNTAIGICSTALGEFTTASGAVSITMGWMTEASGNCSTAMGKDTTASGGNSTAMGSTIIAAGDYSFGVGLDYKMGKWTINQDNTMAIMGGRVGIGTVSPIASLDVDPTMTTTNNYYGIRSDMTFNPGSGTMTNWYGAYIAAPTISTGSITNIYALVTESGAGNVGIGTTSPSTTLEVNGDIAFRADPTPLTIDIDDEITVTHSYHTVSARTGTSDYLDTINGGDVTGQVLIITADSGDTIEVLDEYPSGNIDLVTDFSLDDNNTLVLIYDGTNWLEVSRSSN